MMRFRVTLGVVALVALFAWSLTGGAARESLRSLPALIRLWRTNPPDYASGIGHYEQRFAAVRDQLPPRGTVGYTAVTERAGGQEWIRYTGHGREYILPAEEARYAAQYALTPILLDPNPNHDHPLTVVNVTNSGVYVRRAGDQ
jgi:hypothetical protein